MSEDKATVLTLPQVTPSDVAEIDRLEMIPLGDLVARAHKMAAQGVRFVTATCCDVGDGFEILYHFDRNLEMSHLGVRVPAGSKLPSITGAYLCAFLVENEIADLFGLQIDGLPLDYRSHLLLAGEAEPAPLLKARPQQ